jgi:hypothetical protein
MCNGMTIGELKELLKKQGKEYCDIEVFVMACSNSRLTFHSDYIWGIIDYSDNSKVLDYEIMDEKDYDTSILANGCMRADFKEWYNDKNAKVLCILVEKETEPKFC